MLHTPHLCRHATPLLILRCYSAATLSPTCHFADITPLLRCFSPLLMLFFATLPIRHTTPPCWLVTPAAPRCLLLPLMLRPILSATYATLCHCCRRHAPQLPSADHAIICRASEALLLFDAATITPFRYVILFSLRWFSLFPLILCCYAYCCHYTTATFIDDAATILNDATPLRRRCAAAAAADASDTLPSHDTMPPLMPLRQLMITPIRRRADMLPLLC